MICRCFQFDGKRRASCPLLIEEGFLVGVGKKAEPAWGCQAVFVKNRRNRRIALGRSGVFHTTDSILLGWGKGSWELGRIRPQAF